jgi:hypothetical protein
MLTGFISTMSREVDLISSQNQLETKLGRTEALVAYVQIPKVDP